MTSRTNRRRLARWLARVVRWYKSPSGLLLGSSIALAALAIVGVPGTRWLVLASLGLFSLFVPYRFSREQDRTDQRIAVWTEALEGRIEKARDRLRRTLDEALSSQRESYDKTQNSLQADLERATESLAQVRAGHDRLEADLTNLKRSNLSEMRELAIRFEKESADLGRALKSLQQRFGDVRTEQRRLQEQALSERRQRIDALARAVDEITRFNLVEMAEVDPRRSHAVADQIDGRRLIFCASSGRSGTHFLAELLGSAENVHAVHEGPPYMIGHHLSSVIDHPLAESYEKRRIKAVAIRATLAGLPHHVAYVETNHMFIKTFHDVILNELATADLSVVVLRRSIDKVLKSMIELGYFTPDNTNWPLWMHLPHGDQLSAQPPDPIDDLDEIDRAIGYLFDIEARQQAFVREHPGLDIIETRIEEIQTPDGGRNLMQRLHLKPSAKTDAVAGVASNRRTTSKMRTIDIDECRTRIVDYHGRAVVRGVWVPELTDVMDQS